MLANVIFPFFVFIPDSGWLAIAVIVGCTMIEAAVCSVKFKKPFKGILFLTIWANLLSAIIGGFISFILARFFCGLLPSPSDLKEYCRLVPYNAAICYLIFFIVTVLIEWLFFAWRLRKKDKTIKYSKVLVILLFANILSYLVAIPVHYYSTQPEKILRNVSNETQWAKKPASKIYYLDESKNLMSIFTDGSNKQLIVSGPIDHYLISSDLKNFITWTDGSELYYYNSNNNQKKKIWESDIEGSDLIAWSFKGKLSTANLAAISPNGKWIGWCVPVKGADGDSGPWAPDYWRLYAYNTLNESLSKYDFMANRVKISWSNKENIFYLNCSKLHYPGETGGFSGFVKIILTNEGQFDVTSIETVAKSEICNSYGRVGGVYVSGEKIYTEYRSDKSGELSVSASFGMLFLEKGEKRLLDMCDSDFLTPYYWGTFKEPLFLSNGEECISEARGGIYLMDFNSEKMGKITEGNNYVITTDTCNKRFQFFDYK